MNVQILEKKIPKIEEDYSMSSSLSQLESSDLLISVIIPVYNEENSIKTKKE